MQPAAGTPRRSDGEPTSPLLSPNLGEIEVSTPTWVRKQAMRMMAMCYKMVSSDISDKEFAAVVCFMIGAGKGAGGLSADMVDPSSSWSRLTSN